MYILACDFHFHILISRWRSLTLTCVNSIILKLTCRQLTHAYMLLQMCAEQSEHVWLVHVDDSRRSTGSNNTGVIVGVIVAIIVGLVVAGIVVLLIYLFM